MLKYIDLLCKNFLVIKTSLSIYWVLNDKIFCTKLQRPANHRSSPPRCISWPISELSHLQGLNTRGCMWFLGLIWVYILDTVPIAEFDGVRGSGEALVARCVFTLLVGVVTCVFVQWYWCVTVAYMKLLFMFAVCHIIWTFRSSMYYYEGLRAVFLDFTWSLI